MFQRIVACCLVLGVSGLAQAGALDRYASYAEKTPTVAGSYEVSSQTTESQATVDISGLPSYGGLGDANNVTLLFDLGTGVDAIVTGVAWDVVIEAFSPSWQSEAALALLDSTEGLVVRPGAGTDDPGVGAFSSGGIIDLSDNGFLDIVAPGGILTLELYESFDDGSVAPDGVWLTPSSFTFEFSAVPEPGALAILGIGLCGLLGLRRK